MSKKKTYYTCEGCSNCLSVNQVNIPVGVLKKNFTIPPNTLCSNCGCRLDGKPAGFAEETPFQKAARAYIAEIYAITEVVPWHYSETYYHSIISALRVLWNTRGKLDLNATKGRVDTRHAALSIIGLDESEAK